MLFFLTRASVSSPAPRRLPARSGAKADAAAQRLAGLALAASLNLLALPGAQAEPAGQPATAAAEARSLSDALAQDPVTRLLADKGLLPTGTSRAGEIARQMRDTASDVAADLVLSAMNFLGVPYKRGGNTAETGFDCSGFTRYVFESSVGLVLPRRAEEQARAPGVVQVSRDELKPGDLVFFNTLRRTFSHVGIYIGDGKFIHSPRSGSEVRVEDMRVAYWTRRFDGARRVPLTAPKGADAAAPTLAALPGLPGLTAARPLPLRADSPEALLAP